MANDERPRESAGLRAPSARVAPGDWRFGETWPFEPRWLSVDGVRIHYVDEGPRDARPVVMLHGHPAWSYTYRHFIQGLTEAGFRAVAHDQMGFGRSDKPPAVKDYTVQRHVRHFATLMEALDLKDVTLVLHDWGGPLGLAWAVEHPDRVGRLVLLNTFTGSIPDGARPGALRWIRTMRAPLLGPLLVRGARLPVRAFLLRMGIAHRERIGAAERNAYLRPHPTWSSRAGLLAHPRLWPFEEDNPTRELAGIVEQGLTRLDGKPVLVLRGLRDPAFRSGLLGLGTDRFPDAEVHDFEDASHFVQEDAHERAVPLIVDFMERT